MGIARADRRTAARATAATVRHGLGQPEGGRPEFGLRPEPGAASGPAARRQAAASGVPAAQIYRTNME